MDKVEVAAYPCRRERPSRLRGKYGNFEQGNTE